MENELPNPGRVPKENDLVTLCRALNEHGARYLIVGGFAVIYHGYLRATEDIDVLLAGDLDNQARVKKALETLPDKAILELGDDDLRNYAVVRVSDEILVDLMLAAGGIEYAESESVHRDGRDQRGAHSFCECAFASADEANTSGEGCCRPSFPSPKDCGIVPT
jgi:hypothetical protein